MVQIYKMGQQVWGSSNIVGKVSIDETNNTFTFDVDGASYTLNIPLGIYNTIREGHTSELIEVLQQESSNNNLPVQFKLGALRFEERSNVLVIEHNDKAASHVMGNFGGSANDTLFGTIKYNLAPRD